MSKMRPAQPIRETARAVLPFHEGVEWCHVRRIDTAAANVDDVKGLPRLFVIVGAQRGMTASAARGSPQKRASFLLPWQARGLR
jgi:hypothetical protein